LKTSISTHFGDIHLKIWRTDIPPYWDAKLYYIVDDDLANNKNLSIKMEEQTNGK
jgi:hypothetical protein